jgi:hypothetical protein
MMKQRNFIHYDYGCPLALVALVKAFYPGSAMCNYTGKWWIDISSKVNSLVNIGDKKVHIIDKLSDIKPGNNIYFGELDQHIGATLTNGCMLTLRLTLINNQI